MERLIRVLGNPVSNPHVYQGNSLGGSGPVTHSQLGLPDRAVVLREWRRAEPVNAIAHVSDWSPPQRSASAEKTQKIIFFLHL